MNDGARALRIQLLIGFMCIALVAYFLMLGRRPGKWLFHVNGRTRCQSTNLLIIGLASTPWHREQDHIDVRQGCQFISRRSGLGNPVGLGRF